MQIKDHSGLEYSGAGHTALDHYLAGLTEFQRYTGDPVAAMDRALADSPDFAMAYMAKAYMLAIGTNPSVQQMAGVAYEAASGLPMNERERAHLKVLGLFFSGEIRAAGRVLEDIAIAWPRDVLALQVGQLADFLVGDSRMLRDRIARALPAWSPAMPDWHAVQSLLAFGLEECGDYARAEAAGLESLAHDRRNTWAHHAVAHCFEMQGRRREGAAWMRSLMPDWSVDSSFAVHNSWHLALFHLGLGEIDETLRLYDGPIYGTPS
ncbi:MAG TPA: tetratricopeptide repeat protein, partial [Caulobacteraceae bacterium]|nr:tetratricopeptide repeat protein [Caulobacteraceae bacterium]